MMTDDGLDSEELRLFRENVYSFMENEILPHYADYEKSGIVPADVYLKLGEMGFLCADVPEEYGGFAAPYAFSPVALEEAARLGMSGLSVNLSVHSDIVAPYILHLGTEEQKQTWLPGMVSGEHIGAVAMTEPGAGSDLQGIRTSAVKKGDNYIINGQKTFISNGQHCSVIVLVTKTDPDAGSRGITLFLVDASLPGVSRGRNLEKLGQHCSDTSELFFDNVEVPESAILGKLGGGFGHLMDELPRERIAIALGCVAATDGILKMTVDYVTERKAFGSPISRFQNTRFKLAELKAQLELNKAYMRQCVQKYARGELSAVEASLIKLTSSELQGKAADECLQLFGGYGYMAEYPISAALVDARIQRIYGGTSEIMKELIARSMLGR